MANFDENSVVFRGLQRTLRCYVAEIFVRDQEGFMWLCFVLQLTPKALLSPLYIKPQLLYAPSPLTPSLEPWKLEKLTGKFTRTQARLCIVLSSVDVNKWEYCMTPSIAKKVWEYWDHFDFLQKLGVFCLDLHRQKGIDVMLKLMTWAEA